MSALGLGTWRATKGLVGNAVRFALEEGLYDHIDCSPRYLNEAEIGATAIRPLATARRQDSHP
jgi:diketogulonate reductase-like aldo/keto reductase